MTEPEKEAHQEEEGRQIIRRPITRAIRDWAGFKAELRDPGEDLRCEALKGFWGSEHVRFRACLVGDGPGRPPGVCQPCAVCGAGRQESHSLQAK